MTALPRTAENIRAFCKESLQRKTNVRSFSFLCCIYSLPLNNSSQHQSIILSSEPADTFLALLAKNDPFFLRRQAAILLTMNSSGRDDITLHPAGAQRHTNWAF